MKEPESQLITSGMGHPLRLFERCPALGEPVVASVDWMEKRKSKSLDSQSRSLPGTTPLERKRIRSMT